MSKWRQITPNWSKEVEIRRKNDCSLMLSLRNVPFTHDKTGSFSYVKEIASWHDNWFSIADSLKLPRHQRFDPLPHPARMVLGNKGNLDCSNYRLHITTHQLQCNILISLSQQTGAKAVSQPSQEEATKVTKRIINPAWVKKPNHNNNNTTTIMYDSGEWEPQFDLWSHYELLVSRKAC